MSLAEAGVRETPFRLSDEAVARFIADGFLVLPPAADLPPSIHANICAKIRRAFQDHGDPGNNCVVAVCSQPPIAVRSDRSSSERRRSQSSPI